jgi:hypothetical protein
MSEQGKTTGSQKNLGVILIVIGVIFFIAGIAIATVHGPLRGSGLGTICMVIGVAAVTIGIIRARRKSA